mmetsp:Transcript_35999/g.114439  ORF Transcript_35999/g.114439 Transcript_35999/m.114439 type:complete len:258 (-) Transcript_35999:924-1697(-)
MASPNSTCPKVLNCREAAGLPESSNLAEDVLIGRLRVVPVLPESPVLHQVLHGLPSFGDELRDRHVERLDHEADEADLALGHRLPARLLVAEWGDVHAQRPLLVALRPELGQDPLRPAEHHGPGLAGVGEVRGVQRGLEDEELPLQRLLLLRLAAGARRGRGQALGLLLRGPGLEEELELAQVLRVLRHVRGQDHVDEASPDVVLHVHGRHARLVVLAMESPWQLREPVASLVPLHRLEAQGQVHVLEDALVVVPDS